MQFNELITVIKSCPFEEVRGDRKDFFEAVILKGNLDSLNAKLSPVFGAPAWPSENKLPDGVNNIVQRHGGIMGGQTLYFTHLENHPVFVMFWPWGDKEHITVKIGIEIE